MQPSTETMLMRARYRISEGDYVRAAMLFARLTLRQWMWLVVGPLAPLVLLVMMVALRNRSLDLSRLNDPLLRYYGVIWALLVLYFVARIYLIAPIRALYSYRHNKSMRDSEIEMDVLENGIRWTSRASRARHRWSHFKKWRCNDAYVLVCTGPGDWIVIPAGVAADGFDIGGFKDLLKWHIGAAR